MVEFYVFRHGETNWNLESRIQGHTNIPLNDTGREQAKSLIEKLSNVGIQEIYSSDLDRAKETAEILNSHLNVPMKLTSNLREASFGDAEGMTLEEIKSKYGEEFWDRFSIRGNENPDIKFPNGESRGESIKRMRSVIFDIKETGLKAIAISCHGGVARNLLHSFLPPEADRVQIPNCVCYKLTHHLDRDEWTVEGPL